MVETQLGKPNPIFDPLTTFYSCCTWECFVKLQVPTLVWVTSKSNERRVSQIGILLIDVFRTADSRCCGSFAPWKLSPGKWSQHQICRSSRRILIIPSDIQCHFWGCPLHGQELDSLILVGPFQLRIFWNSKDPLGIKSCKDAQHMSTMFNKLLRCEYQM